MKVLITGTSRGIGRAVAQRFLEQGHSVIGMDREPSAITSPEYCHMILDILQDPLPDLDGVNILINNAGVQNTGMDIDINLKGTIRITEKYGIQPEIRSILFIASASASTGAEFPEYAASKGGVVTYMKNTAQRIAPFGATANSLSPGGVITALNDHILNNPVLWDAVLKETLLSKWMTLEEVADWAYFMTVTNKSMTAQDILVDNGEAARYNFIW